jgi:hypothetical protein
LRVVRNFDGGELPHARKQDAVVRAGILHQYRAGTGITKNRGGDSDPDSAALVAGSGDFRCGAEGIGAAPARGGTDFAARGLRRADGLAQFHERLVPIPGGIARKPILRGCGERTPAVWLAQIAAEGAQARENARDIAVEDGERRVVGDAQDRRGGVAADPG